VGFVVLGSCALGESWALIFLTASQMPSQVASDTTTSSGGSTSASTETTELTWEASTFFCNFDAKLISDTASSTLMYLEILGSYFLPFLVILVLDVSVFARVYVWQPQAANDVRRRVVLADCGRQQQQPTETTTMLNLNQPITNDSV